MAGLKGGWHRMVCSGADCRHGLNGAGNKNAERRSTIPRLRSSLRGPLDQPSKALTGADTPVDSMPFR